MFTVTNIKIYLKKELGGLYLKKACLFNNVLFSKMYTPSISTKISHRNMFLLDAKILRLKRYFDVNYNCYEF